MLFPNVQLGVSKVFIFFFIRPHLVEQKYCKKQEYCEILLQFRITIFYINMYCLRIIYYYSMLKSWKHIFLDSLIKRMFKKLREIFRIITVTFDQFNASLLNKVLIALKSITDHSFFNDSVLLWNTWYIYIYIYTKIDLWIFCSVLNKQIMFNEYVDYSILLNESVKLCSLY